LNSRTAENAEGAEGAESKTGLMKGFRRARLSAVPLPVNKKWGL
jgi:hypothetical protein